MHVARVKKKKNPRREGKRKSAEEQLVAAQPRTIIRHYLAFSSRANAFTRENIVLSRVRVVVDAQLSKPTKRGGTDNKIGPGWLERFHSRDTRSPSRSRGGGRGVGTGKSGRIGGNGGRRKEKKKKRKERRKWQQLSYRRKLPPSVYPATIRYCVPSTSPHHLAPRFHRFAFTPFFFTFQFLLPSRLLCPRFLFVPLIGALLASFSQAREKSRDRLKISN